MMTEFLVDYPAVVKCTVWCVNLIKMSIILLEVAIRGWEHGGHKGMDMFRDNAQVGRGI